MTKLTTVPKTSPTRPTVERVARLIRANPTLTAADIAREVGVSRERVRQILDGLGYVSRWVRRPRARR